MTDAEAPRKPGRPRDPDLEARRRAEILGVAAGVFAEAGFAAADVQVIADRIGVGKGTVYRYFPTKEALFLAAVGKGLEELEAEMDAAITTDQDLDAVGMMRRAIRAYLGFFHRRPEMAELFIQERAAFKDHHRPLYFADDPNCDVKHQKFFERLTATGAIRPIPMERFFGVIGDLLYGTILTNLLSGRPADPDTQTKDVLDVVLNGVLSDAGRERRAKPGRAAAGRKR
jgi:AcrR family transcriptional regulator